MLGIRHYRSTAIDLYQGDITRFVCDGIVNAANMEVQFGGGISGAIATATHDKANIDLEADHSIQQFWSDYEATQLAV